MAKAGRGSEQVMVRLPDGMRDRIREAAEQNNRSMNAEIVAALEEAFPERISLGAFLDEWAVPAARAETVDEREQLLREANRAAKAVKSRYRAALGEGMGKLTIDIIDLEGGGTQTIRTTIFTDTPAPLEK